MSQLPRPLPGLGSSGGGKIQSPLPPVPGPGPRTGPDLDELRLQQNLPLGILGGALAAAVSAAIWAAITAATGFQIGWMAVGVGILVGLGVRVLGKGVDNSFRVAGAALALLGCAAGNLCAGCFVVAGALTEASGVPVSFLDVLTTPSIWAEIMQATFHPMDLLFYGIAVYEGWRFSAL